MINKIGYCLFILLGLMGCRKTYNNPIVPYVFNASPVKPGYMELNPSFFLTLPDNSFLISCKAPESSHLDEEVFLHYDENLHFLDSVYYSEVVSFGSGFVLNQSIFNVLLQADRNRKKFNYTLVETDFRYRKKNQSGNLVDSMGAVPYHYLPPQICQLQNSTIVTAITAKKSGTVQTVNLMAFNSHVNSPVLWKNDTNYAADDMNSTVFRSMAADGNFFYVLCSEYNTGNGILRKHDEHGKLVWKKTIPNYIGTGMLVETDKIVLYGLFGNNLTLKIFDEQGNQYPETNLLPHNLFTDGSSGFVGLALLTIPPKAGQSAYYQTLVSKYNAGFVPIQKRVLGDVFYSKCVMGKMNDGSYVVVISKRVQSAGEQLIFYRLDGNLEDYYK